MKHLQLTEDGTVLELTLLQNGELEIHINDPWAGDSTSGYGRELSISLSPKQITELKKFFNPNSITEEEVQSMRALAHAGLPNECVLNYGEVKFCSFRNGDGNACKQCSDYNR